MILVLLIVLASSSSPPSFAPLADGATEGRQEDPRVALLGHGDWTVRRDQANICGKTKVVAAVPKLIELAGEDREEVRAAASAALKLITGREFPDAKGWAAWLEGDDARKYREAAANQSLEAIQARLASLELETKKLKDRVDDTKIESRYVALTMATIGAFFVLIMFYFVGHVSSRIKEWKELVNRGEGTIRKGEEITQRTDKIIAELDAKKADVMGFFAKVKEDNQAEFDRYCDILQKNLEHRMREEVMAYRQKAEKELQQTLGDLRTQIDQELRRSAGEHRDRLMKEVQAEELYIQAKSFALNGRHEEALRVYRRLLAAKPDHRLAWNDSGLALHAMKRHDEALEAYQKALALQPDDSAVLYNIAAAYARLKQRDKMLETLALALRHDGEFKDEALNDEAFREYWNDPKFKDLAEA